MCPHPATLGPRIVFKEGGKGAYLFPAHYRDPLICRLLCVAAETAPPLVGNVLVVTEGWRNKDDQHGRIEALDFRTGIDQPDREGAIEGTDRVIRMAHAHDWVEKMGERLGTDFYIKFGDYRHIDHIHGQRDP